ncbi:MAG TPA: prenyltransferase/squalene oxidase repeat-containing protein [Bryobacteraceae bacterium]|nr:prenyltransferase/squalene oxidase repeat-containing protein [Bryobacteraceae bacterium]
MRRRYFLGVLMAQAACVRTAQTAVAKAARWLWKQQAGDGGWHSHTYGLLRSGQSLTPFVLDALLQVPSSEVPVPASQVDRAIAFIRRNTRPDGSLGMADPGIPDYPNYSTSLAVSAMCRAGRVELARPMVEYLRRHQFTEQDGWTKSDAAYGAWGMGGELRTPPDTGHVDLSMTRYVLEALRAAGIGDGDAVFERAGVYLSRLQSPDGGFFFSTTEFDTNKAGHDGQRFRSYGTTTADGILALLATGRGPQDAGVMAARSWLAARHHDMAVPGFIGEAYQRWPRGLAFYYAAASASAFRALRIDGGKGVEEGLMRTQRGDGSWSNPENLVKEDDPLIATPFALRALV